MLNLLAQSRVESADFVVARRGRTPPLTPPQHGGARFPDARRLRADRLDAALSRLANVSQQLSPGAETIVDERTQERPDHRVDEGDHERFSHYVPKDKLTDAMVMGTPVVALCGKVWVPSRDPERFPVCPECKEIWESLKPGGDKN